MSRINDYLTEASISESNPYRYRMTCDPGAKEVSCSHCANRINGLICGAFPEGIPRSVISHVYRDPKSECALGFQFEK